MKDLEARVKELALQGLCCSQVIMALTLEEHGQEDELLMEAVSGLCNGLYSDLVCGALSAGACMLALRAGSAHSVPLIADLVDWFRGEFGSTECASLLAGDQFNRFTLCPNIMVSVYRQASAMLCAAGFPQGGEECGVAGGD